MSVNGSSEDGNCSLIVTICNEPTISVLQDGIIPTLTGLDGDMWASQLLTINTDSPTIDITFDFEATPGYVGVQRVEVVMFNCPEGGISVDSITLYGSNTTTSIGSALTTISPTITSCDSLVRVCISRPVSSTLTALILRFQLSSASTWVHLAEVSFYENSLTCLSDSILESPTKSEANVSVPTTTLRNGNTDTETPPETTETAPTDTETAPSTITIATIIVVLFIIIIIVVVTIIVVVICVRAYSSRHKINITISGEGHTASLGHPHIDESHSKFSLCEETGQVYYSTALSKEDDSLDQMYNQVQAAPVKSSHSTKSNDDPEEQRYDHVQRYSHEDMEQSCYSTTSNKEDDVSDQTYSHIKRDDGRGKNLMQGNSNTQKGVLGVEMGEYSTLSSFRESRIESTMSPQANAPMDQLYAHVNKKGRKGVNTPAPPQTNKKKETCVLPVEFDIVYSVVNKPSPPAIPKKSDLLMEDEF